MTRVRLFAGLLIGTLLGIIVSFIPLAHAAVGAVFDTIDRALFIAKDGYTMVIGTEGTDNFSLIANNAEVVDVASTGITVTGNVSATGNLALSATGKTLQIQEATAASKCMGTATANGTTAVTVATTCVLTASRIFLSRTSLVAAGVTEPGCWATNIVNATSFDLDCNDAGEDSTFNWIIINEAA